MERHKAHQNDFLKKIFICVLKMNKSLTVLEGHDDNYDYDDMMMINDSFHFWVNYPFN